MFDFDKDYDDHVKRGGENWDIDEIYEKADKDLKNGGYSKMMSDVEKAKSLTFKTFYKVYCKKTGMTKHQVNEELIDLGIIDYNNYMKTSCKDIDEVFKDMITEGGLSGMTRMDTISALQDRGMMKILHDEYKADSAYEFLTSQGVEYPE